MRRMNSARWALLVSVPAVLAGCSREAGTSEVSAELDGDRLYADAARAARERNELAQQRLEELNVSRRAQGVKQLNERVQAWVDRRAELDPDWATRVGVHDYDDRLTRLNDASWEARRLLAWQELDAVPQGPPYFSVESPADVRLFQSLLAAELHEYDRHDARTDTPSLPLDGIAAVNDLLIGDFAPQSQRAMLAVLRLQQLPEVLDEARAHLGRPPKLWTEMAIRETDGALAFLDGVPERAGPTPGLADAIALARAALSGYRGWLQQELLPRSDGQFAVGRAEFEWRLHNVYLLDLDADELLAIGEDQFEKTLAMLEQTARTIDPSRDWQALLGEMMEQHPTSAELLDTYRGEVARARQFLIDHDIVGIPDEQLQIRETPAFLRTTVPFAAYDAPAPLDPSRLGTFYVTPDPAAHILADIPNTVWHEAYPGHHLQLVYAKDNPSLVRRLNDSPLLSEGWGFYCEELASEAGYYDDPRERLMQLNWRLQRAARVILDVSIHVFCMGYEPAVDFLVRRVGLARGAAEASVNAYTRRPAYFSSYLLGMLEIVRLREECRSRLGARFSLREFHERLLRCGNVPPALVEQALVDWN
jgi:uncharacterized protein (DUF885 family)